jgi:1,4-dihydroxy-2-naphthoate octaprenyltransferase
MKKLALWLKAMRAPFFTASLIPVMVGTALAGRWGIFRVIPLTLALIIVLANHAGANLLNDFCDANGSDPINRRVTPFSGGSRMIQKGILTQRAVFFGAMVSYGFGLGIAFCLSVIYENWLVFGLALAGAALGVVYSLVPIAGMNRGWGELAVGMAFGPLAVMGSFLLQRGVIIPESFWAGVPVGFLVMGILILNEFPDIEADRTVGKRNWIVRLGSVRGVWVYMTVVSLAYLTILVEVISGIFPVSLLFSYITLPLAVWIFLKVWRYRDQVPQIIPALAGNIGLHLVTGLVLCIGFWWR